MGGKRFYTYQKKDVRFFALDSNYMDKDQQRWLEEELSKSNAKWKIAYFHHPLYSSGAAHGSEVDLRAIIEPLFIKYNLTSSLPATSTSTSGSSRRRAFTTSPPAAPPSCAAATSSATPD